jgi:hypothetical protein
MEFHYMSTSTTLFRIENKKPVVLFILSTVLALASGLLPVFDSWSKTSMYRTQCARNYGREQQIHRQTLPTFPNKMC